MTETVRATVYLQVQPDYSPHPIEVEAEDANEAQS